MRKFIYIFLFSLCFSTISYSQREQDSLALIALYNSTGGANWTNNTNWLSSEPISKWFGVTMFENRVQRLYLGENNLVGTIPEEIGNLSNLTLLSLVANHLNGTIPYGIWNLFKLNSLDLGSNQLSGTIPPDVSNLINLSDLALNNNQFTGKIPPEIGLISNLYNLNLANNQLSESIPVEICNLSNLYSLYLFNNQLNGNIPTQIGNLVNLWNLYLNDNLLTGNIPIEIGNLKWLQALFLQNNQLTGIIPTELSNLSKLATIWLSNNQLSGNIPPGFGNLSDLYFIWISNNNLSGTIPMEIWNMSWLGGLDLSFNHFSGSIPPEIGNLINLKELDLANNQLSGSIPVEIGKLSKLYNLDISENMFSELPIIGLDTLIVFYIYGNHFTFEDIEPNINIKTQRYQDSPQESIGTEQYISRRINKSYTFNVTCGGANNLYQWYKDNTIIPSAIQSTYKITKLKQTDAGSYTCAVTNTIVPGLSIISKQINLSIILNGRVIDSLSLVSLYNSTGGETWTNKTNWLSSEPISTWYGVTVESNIGKKSYNDDTTSVVTLSLVGNNLSGQIPKEIGNMTCMQELKLDDNHLSGSVPEEINNLTSLQVLKLSNNELSNLPVITISSLDTLLINNNQFTFEDIQPNLTLPGIGINYSLQDSIGIIIDTLCYPGSEFTFFASDTAFHNIYRWYKDGILIPEATSKFYYIESLLETDAGVYTCIITNTNVSDLTLYQRPAILRISNSNRFGFTENPRIRVYPNPTDEILFIETNKDFEGKTRIILSDIYGKSAIDIDTEDNKKFELNITNLSKGIYILQIQNKKSRYFQKVIIQ